MGLVGRTAIQLAELVRTRRSSATEVVREHLDQIARLDDRVRAFQVVRAERALDEAARLDDDPRLSEMPLAGVPVSIKDEVDVAGEPTRKGSAGSSPDPVANDDELVKRLRAAGCVVIGKTRVPELCIFHFTDSEAFGSTYNPWSLSRTSGGSSGGAAAAVAAGMVPLSLGADGLGSIRIPSAWCGAFGIKPGSGVVPKATAGFDWYGLAEYGPITSTVADAAVMLDVLAGGRGLAPAPAAEKPLRLALSLKPPTAGVRVDREIRFAVDASAEALRSAGHTITVIDPTYPQTLGLSLMQTWFSSIAVDARKYRFDGLERRTQGMVRIGEWLERHHHVRPEPALHWRERMKTWFTSEGIDALILPSTALTAPVAGRWSGKGWLATILGGTKHAPFAAPWNFAGFPAASVPAGISGDGTPIGVQVVVPPGQERLILQIAAQLEQLRPWPRHAPIAALSEPA